MRKVNVSSVIDNSKFNGFFLSVLAIVVFAQLFDGYDTAIYGVSLPLMMKELKLNPTQAGLLASASQLGLFLGSIVMGMFADKAGRKAALIVGIAFYSIFTGWCGLSYGVMSFAIVRFLAGIGLAAMTPVSAAMLSEYSPKRWRSFMVGSNSIGMNFGQFLVTLTGIVLIGALGWRALYLIAFVPVLLILLVHFYAPNRWSSM